MITTPGEPDYTYDEFADEDVPVICNKCGNNSWREGGDGDSFCVPCHYGLSGSANKFR